MTPPSDDERGLDPDATSQRPYQQPVSRSRNGRQRMPRSDQGIDIARNVPLPKGISVSVRLVVRGGVGPNGGEIPLNADFDARRIPVTPEAKYVHINGELMTEFSAPRVGGSLNIPFISQDFSSKWLIKLNQGTISIDENALLSINGPFFDLPEVDLSNFLDPLSGRDSALDQLPGWAFQMILPDLFSRQLLLRAAGRLPQAGAAAARGTRDRLSQSSIKELLENVREVIPEFPLPVVPFVVAEIVPTTNGEEYVMLGVRVEGLSFGVGAGIEVVSAQASLPAGRVEKTFPLFLV